MSRAAAIVAGIAAMLAAAWARAREARPLDPSQVPVQDMSPQLPAWEEAAGIAPDDMPAANPSQADRNVAAFLAMIRAAEGTAGQGGYGALFGWPRSGRSFDPYTVSGHPRQFFQFTDKAGRTKNTSAAGAYQITWTTWSDYRVPFVAWATLNGYSTQGFLPATQDAFAMFLLNIDGALEHVRAGRLDQAIAIARRRWASLPGAGYDQPERTADYVQAAYTSAGGVIA